MKTLLYFIVLLLISIGLSLSGWAYNLASLGAVLVCAFTVFISSLLPLALINDAEKLRKINSSPRIIRWIGMILMLAIGIAWAVTGHPYLGSTFLIIYFICRFSNKLIIEIAKGMTAKEQA